MKKNSRLPLGPRKGLEKGLTSTLIALGFAINAFLVLLCVEWLSRRSYDSILAWSAGHVIYLFPTWLLILACTLLFAALRGKPSRGVRWGNGFLFLLAAISYYKFEYRSEPLVFSDFFEVTEALMIAPELDFVFPPLIVGTLLFMFFLLPLLMPGDAWRIRSKKGILGILAGVLFFFYAAQSLVSVPTPRAFLYQELYNECGFLRGFIDTAFAGGFTKPENYTRERIESWLQDTNAQDDVSVVQPDVFFIMSESLYDLASYTDLELNRDPLQGFKVLQAQGTSADVMALGLGGGTFPSEYEVLTGYRSVDGNGSLIFDRESIQPGMQTLPSLLKAHGYRTAAMHPNTGSFYNRKRNYPKLGFDETYFSDQGLPPMEDYAGQFPSDRALFEYILRWYHTSQDDAPVFLHTVTFQNHGGYLYPPVKTDVHVTNRSGEERQAAENYANGILDHVEALEDFLAELQQENRPIIVVVWGDHAPNLKSFGISTPKDKIEAASHFLTPLLVWNNYGAKFTLDDPVIPPYRLGAWLAHQLGFREDRYFNYLATGAQTDTMTILRLCEQGGAFLNDPALYQDVDAALYMMHYDRLLGNNWIKEGVK